MESSGKSVKGNGETLGIPSGVIVLGDTGTNAQHSFFQLMHQGRHLSQLNLLELPTPQGHQIREYFIQQEKVAKRSVAHSIQVEVGRAMQYFEQFNASLSNAARFLSVGGKQTKPKLLSDLEKLLKSST